MLKSDIVKHLLFTFITTVFDGQTIKHTLVLFIYLCLHSLSRLVTLKPLIYIITNCSWISVNLKHPSHFLRIISTWQGLHDTYRHRAGCSIRGCKDTFNLLKTLLLYNPRLCQYDLMWQIFLRYITSQFYI